MSTTHADIWALAERLALEWETGPHGIVSKQVRSALYDAIRLAVTVPLTVPEHRLLTDLETRTGRVLRPHPGVMACSCHGCDYGGSTDPLRHEFSGSCTCCRDRCNGSGTVPDPSEAGRVARLMGCGLLGPVEDALEVAAHAAIMEAPDGARVPVYRAWTALSIALRDRNYDGGLDAVAEALAALVPEEVA